MRWLDRAGHWFKSNALADDLTRTRRVARFISCVLLPFATLLEPCHLQRYSGEHQEEFLQPVPLADCDRSHPPFAPHAEPRVLCRCVCMSALSNIFNVAVHVCTRCHMRSMWLCICACAALTAPALRVQHHAGGARILCDHGAAALDAGNAGLRRLHAPRRALLEPRRHVPGRARPSFSRSRPPHPFPVVASFVAQQPARELRGGADGVWRGRGLRSAAGRAGIAQLSGRRHLHLRLDLGAYVAAGSPGPVPATLLAQPTFLFVFAGCNLTGCGRVGSSKTLSKGL